MNIQTTPFQFVFARDTTSLSGVDGVHYYLAKELIARRIPVLFISIGEPDGQFGEFPQVFIHAKDSWHRKFQIGPKRKAKFDIKYYHKVVNELLKQGDTQLFFFAGHLHYLWSQSPRPQVTQIGVIHHPHDNIEAFRKYHSSWDHTIAVSQAVKDSVVSKFPDSETQITAIDNGVSAQPALAESTADILHILWCGRLEKESKCADNLVPLVKSLQNKGVKFQLSVAGDGSLLSFLRNELKEYVDTQQIIFHGKLERKELIAQYQSADVILSLSTHEGISIALLEAMSFGAVPVISSGNAVICEKLQKTELSFIFDYQDLDKCAEHLANFASDLDRVRHLKTIAPAFVEEHYSARSMTDKYLDLLLSSTT